MVVLPFQVHKLVVFGLGHFDGEHQLRKVLHALLHPNVTVLVAVHPLSLLPLVLLPLLAHPVQALVGTTHLHFPLSSLPIRRLHSPRTLVLGTVPLEITQIHVPFLVAS